MYMDLQILQYGENCHKRSLSITKGEFKYFKTGQDAFCQFKKVQAAAPLKIGIERTLQIHTYTCIYTYIFIRTYNKYIYDMKSLTINRQSILQISLKYFMNAMCVFSSCMTAMVKECGLMRFPWD